MIHIKLDDFGASIEIENENGEKQYKYLSLNKFKQVVLQGTKFDSGLLSAGTIAYQRTSDGERIAVLKQSCIMHIKYRGRDKKDEDPPEEFNVLIPHLLWIFDFKSNRELQNSRVYALKKEIITESTILYQVPFSNVHTNSEVCWGDAADMIMRRPFKSLVGASSLTRFFFETVFNNDLSTMVEDNGIQVPKVLKWLKDYNNKNEFPYDSLIPYKSFIEVWSNGNE